MLKKRIGEILVEKGLINQATLEKALEEQRYTKEFLGTILVRWGYIEEDDLLMVLSEQFNIPFVKTDYFYLDKNLLKRFSPSLIFDAQCVPIKADEFSITFAIINPLEVWVIRKAEEEAGAFKVKLVLVGQQQMQELLKRCRQLL